MSEGPSARSRDLFLSGFYCAESVLLSIAEDRDIHSDLIPMIATGFCSGQGRGGDQCGALSGGIMGISLITGRRSHDESVEETFTTVRKLIEGFRERFGATSCKELIMCDLNTDEGQAEFIHKNHLETCAQFCAGTTELTLTILDSRDENQ